MTDTCSRLLLQQARLVHFYSHTLPTCSAINAPIDPMRSEASSAGFYISPLGSKHPKIQILTIAELLDGRKIDYPSQGVNVTFEKAPQK